MCHWCLQIISNQQFWGILGIPRDSYRETTDVPRNYGACDNQGYHAKPFPTRTHRGVLKWKIDHEIVICIMNWFKYYKHCKSSNWTRMYSTRPGLLELDFDPRPNFTSWPGFAWNLTWPSWDQNVTQPRFPYSARKLFKTTVCSLSKVLRAAKLLNIYVFQILFVNPYQRRLLFT